MNPLIYNIIHSTVYILALTPFWLIYRISDLLFYLFYYVFNYRKDIVLDNLKNSFPKKSQDEIDKICKAYYKYFIDFMLETFKTLTMSEKEAKKRCVIDSNSLNLLEDLYKKNKDLILVLGHFGNWEFGGTSFSSQCSHQLYVIYKPLASKYFDKLIYSMRARWGTKLIPIKETYTEMKKNKNTRSTTAFIADQTPAPDNAYWTTFLNQDTPVFWGTERIARKLDYPIIYMAVKRIKRGYYKLFTEMLVENPRQTKEGEISELHTRRLERDIFDQPEIWLWSHRRWKHKDKSQLKN